jgi:hypothetical protein
VTRLLLIAGVVMLPLGWILVFASGYGGNSTGGSEIVWRVGGLMVYAAIPILFFAVLIQVLRGMSATRRRRPLDH